MSAVLANHTAQPLTVRHELSPGSYPDTSSLAAGSFDQIAHDFQRIGALMGGSWSEKDQSTGEYVVAKRIFAPSMRHVLLSFIDKKDMPVLTEADLWIEKDEASMYKDLYAAFLGEAATSD